MHHAELDKLKQRFAGYCRTFYSADQADQKNILLKEEHTRRVCDNIVRIARHLGLEEGRVALAEVVALFHDVGRFPQYRQFRTFRDSISVNHAALGARILVENDLLGNVPGPERSLIIRSVALHNVFTVPEGLDDETLLYLKLIRDADKLDIWRVFIEYCGQPDAERPTAAGLGLPDTNDYSPDVLASLLRREMVHLSALRTLNDFKLLQLAWIFDLNFPRSLELVLERSYIDRLSSTLPETGEIGRAVDSVRNYVRSRISANRL